jgi:hypothetical protein
MDYGNGRATYVDQGKDNGSILSIINMDIGYKSEEITAQGIPEPPSPVGESCDLPGSSRQSSSDWKNDERRVGPRTTSRSENTSGDQLIEGSEEETVEKWKNTKNKGERRRIAPPQGKELCKSLNLKTTYVK